MMQHSPGVTVSEVLSLVPGTQVLAGAEGLNRLVQSVGVLEAPDSLHFIKTGDLVLTALWAIRHDREAQMRLLPNLMSRGAAGLAIKLSYVSELPEGVLAFANAHAFPLLMLNADMPYSEAMALVIKQIVSQQALVLERQQRAHKAVMQAVLEAKGLQRLSNTLAELIDNPVVIRDHAGHVLAIGLSGNASAGLDLEQMSKLDARSTDYMLSAGDTVHGVESVNLQGRRITRVVTPIKTGKHAYGHVQAWELERPMSELDLSIIDSVTTVIALELANRRALLEVERRYHNEFLAALFSRQGESEQELAMRARRFGWDLTKPHYAVALKVNLTGARSPKDAEELQILEDQMYDTIARSVGGGAVVGQAELHTVILVPHKPRGDAKEEGLALARQMKAQAEAIGRTLQVTLGVGAVQSGVAGLRRSFQEARRAIHIGERVWGSGGVFHHTDLGLYQILSMLEPTTPELQEFLAGARHLVEYDSEHRTELVQTLEMYFACKGNVRKASEKMYAHYNTILYRLQRIEQITGLSLADADGRLYLQVALKAVNLYK
jgi:purine catabolism regulator